MTRTLACLLLTLIAGCGSGASVEEPTPMTSASPFEFPLDLWDQGVEGETVLLIHVNALGEVDSVVVHQSSGFPQFDSAAHAGAYDLRFVPGRRGDKRVNMWARLPVRFTREDGSVPAPAERDR